MTSQNRSKVVFWPNLQGPYTMKLMYFDFKLFKVLDNSFIHKLLVFGHVGTFGDVTIEPEAGDPKNVVFWGFLELECPFYMISP